MSLLMCGSLVSTGGLRCKTDMGKYVARDRARFKGCSGPVNIPCGAVLEEQDGLLFWRGEAVCTTKCQNAYDYFSQDNDGQGKLRGKLVTAIKATLEKRDSGYQARWDKVWDDDLCQKYRRPEHEDWWLWNHDFFNAPIQDLQHIAWLVRARVSR